MGACALVTGGAGFIGSHVVDRLMRDGADVHVLDDMSNGSLNNLSEWADNTRLKLIKGDIRNRDSVQEALENVEVVFHQAAKVSVPLSVQNPLLVMDINVLGSTVLLNECRKADVKKVVVASSSSIYGDTPTLPKIESMQPNPISPYAVSKLAAESVALSFYRTYGISTTSLRYFNVYGPRQRGGSYAGVISIFISRAFNNEPLPIDGDGEQTRDFTYVSDVVECNILAAESSRSKGQIYNVGGGSRITINYLADEIIQSAGSDSPKIHQDPRIGDVRDSMAGLGKITDHLGYTPKVDLSSGIRKTIDWTRQTI
jgi:UDP-glucose 4-epimerase